MTESKNAKVGKNSKIPLPKPLREGQERPRETHGRPKVSPKITETSFPAQRENSQLTEEPCTSYSTPSGNEPENCFDFFCVFWYPDFPSCLGFERQDSRNFSRWMSRWCKEHLPFWATASGPQFLCVQNGGGGLDYTDQVFFPVSKCSNSCYLNLDSGSPFSFPRPPEELRCLNMVVGTGFGILVAWFHLLHHLQDSLDANQLSTWWPFPQIEHSHSTSMRECELN